MTEKATNTDGGGLQETTLGKDEILSWEEQVKSLKNNQLLCLVRADEIREKTWGSDVHKPVNKKGGSDKFIPPPLRQMSPWSTF